MRTESFKGRTGRDIPNQVMIHLENGVMFESYGSAIAFIPHDGKIKLDAYYWDYSQTTGKYRNEFLGELMADTIKKIKSGEYELVNLNKKTVPGHPSNCDCVRCN